MGQKVNPIGIRLGIVKSWNSKWYASKNYAQLLNEDINLRKDLKKKLYAAAISRIQIERPANNAVVTIHTARPGILIGKKGGGIEGLRSEISSKLGVPVHLNIEEVKKPELDSTLVAEGIAQQLEQRVMFRRAMKRAVTSAMKSGAKGIKICVSGRLGGAEIARSEWYREGRVPLHTFRADIDYGTAEAKTTYGIIGVKVWIFKGEVLPQKNRNADSSK
ncbi:30S ribosomal protein S3 [Legionella quinlivanii]|uniref:Small ribosomal subunit protein uS3 n=1 Tax=Legionella quinlivanii TaxID=45073 RepID=A0A0W0XYH3_9GAMM|nr:MULTISPECIES: 30S ribosomal protein S3 [Legionella]KTD49621.1 30S ribosomal protein S3 [Legionella quinlivanii]MCE3044556.1 30S ribosomal protein S3 [Legionella sp. 16cNR16C]MCW8452015.1 30S ribosomal protein S3 [Legionella quinlivanii]RAP35172.1 30S ribosomal protein S3 [Legionella quinlivanii]SEG31569.1 small subunit ribosomal protein S3 [Legionella quinlivanii DSM 21216]